MGWVSSLSHSFGSSVSNSVTGGIRFTLSAGLDLTVVTHVKAQPRAVVSISIFCKVHLLQLPSSKSWTL